MGSIVHELFTVHLLNEKGLEKARELAAEFSKLAFYIEETFPPSREKSLVLTHLQDAGFHAKRALEEVPDHQM